MAITFEVKLTWPQIEMLFAFIKLEKRKKPPKLKLVKQGASIATARALVSERLIEVMKAKVGESSTWRVTKKGYMVANLVKEDMHAIKKLPKVADADFIFWYDMPPQLTTCVGMDGESGRGKMEAHIN